jgi:hypothetical protein
LDIKTVIGLGAILSVIGTILLVVFISSLLLYPVIKKCQNTTEGCKYYSTAPEPIRSFIKPIFLVVILLVIAAGVGGIRFGKWHEYKKERNRGLSLS